MKEIKEKSKLKTIFEAFTKGADIPDEIANYRREICKKCEFNSENVVNLSFIDRLRKRTVKQPFCTVCKCQIREKCGKGNQICGLIEENKTPKWFNITLEVAGGSFKVINKSDNKSTIQIKENGIEIGVYDVTEALKPVEELDKTSFENIPIGIVGEGLAPFIPQGTSRNAEVIGIESAKDRDVIIIDVEDVSNFRDLKKGSIIGHISIFLQGIEQRINIKYIKKS